MENKKANHDQRKWFLLSLVALTPFGITEGNPSSPKSNVENEKSKRLNVLISLSFLIGPSEKIYSNNIRNYFFWIPQLDRTNHISGRRTLTSSCAPSFNQ